jgi:hypothetical protein
MDTKLKKMMAVDLQGALADVKKALRPIETFKEGIPAIADLIGVVKFIKALGLTKPQYYRRVYNETPWTDEELLRVNGIMEELRRNFK